MYLLNQSIENGYNPWSISLLVVVSSVLGIFTISSKNTIYSVLYLIALFISIALYLIVLNLVFIGISYLLVYVGAVSILFLFIVMLINVRMAELLTEERNSTVLAVLVVLTFSLVFNDKLFFLLAINDYFSQLVSYFYNYDNFTIYSHDINVLLSSYSQNYLGLVSTSQWDNNLIEVSHITGIGNILYNELIVQLGIISFILLLAMIGAIVITVRTDKQTEQKFSSENNISLNTERSTMFSNLLKTG